MKLNLPAIVLIISFFSCSQFLCAQINEPSDIFGYTWGTPYKTCLKKLKDSKIKCSVEKDIEIIYKDNGYDIKLEFENGLFQVLKTQTFPSNEQEKAMDCFNKVLEELVDTHGNYKKPKVQEREVLVFEWRFKKTAMTLIFFIPSNTITLDYSML